LGQRQRIGVGARLIREALGRAEEAGEPAVMVEGIPAYYPRFGFESSNGPVSGMNPERTTHGAADRRDASPVASV